MTFRALTGMTLIAIGTSLASRAAVAGQSAQTTVGPIAYQSCYFDHWDTYQYICSVVVWADGLETVVATQGNTPRWSPDGSRIVFVGDLEGDIKVVNLADLTVFNLTSDPAGNRAPAWSPDGSTIAFVSDRTGIPELYRVNDDGTGRVRLTTAIGFNGQFAWAPDGRTIALGRNVAGESDLYRINADGSGMVRLTSGLGGIGEFGWSSDGRQIVFDCAADVCVINADATGLARLTTSGRGAVFAPGDRRIAFVTTSFGPAPEVALRNEDGTVVRVAPGTAATNPVWSPDGTSLLLEGATPYDYEGCCSNGCNADTYCTPLYGLYMVDALGSSLQLLGKGGNPDWLRPRPGQPFAAFTYQCAGSSCAFDASGSSDPDGAIAGYGWRWGDGTTSTGATISHAYATGGTFTVTLSVTDNDGITTAVSKRIIANAPPTASFVASCGAGRCTYDASGSSDPDGTITSYEWTLGDGATLSQSVSTATHSYRTGTFTVQLVVRDNGGASATASATVQTVNSPPVASFVKTCDPIRCTFDASASADPEGRALQYYAWNFGDGSGVVGTAIQEHTYTAPGTYRVVLTVADDVGQQATFDATIAIPIQPGSMHVGDLDATTTPGPKPSSILKVTVLAHDADHRPVSSARVTGVWSTGEAGGCTTDGTGLCTVSTSLRGSQVGTTFTIQTLAHGAYVYQGPNHDPDGDSNGTTVTFKKK
jgi:PKD repeat protein